MSKRIDDLMARLEARITPETAKAIDRAFEFQFVGTDRVWSLDLTQSQGSEACRLGMNADDLEDLLAGTASLGLLFQTGRLRVFSNIGDAMLLEKIFESKAG